VVGQWDPIYEPIEGGSGEVAARPAAATEHLAPETHDDPVHPLQRADISGNAIIGVVPAESDVSAWTCSWIDRCLICRIWSHNNIRLRRKRDFSVRIPTLKLPFRLHVQYSVKPRKKIDRFRALPAVPTRVSLREPAKFDQLGLGRFERKAELAEPFAQGVLQAQSILAKLKAHYKVVDISHQVGFAPQARLRHALNTVIETIWGRGYRVRAIRAEYHRYPILVKSKMTPDRGPATSRMTRDGGPAFSRPWRIEAG
jgi:hypothetical protein